GGGSLAPDVTDGLSDKNIVFSSRGDISHNSAVFILQGGPDFHAASLVLTGWRDLGYPFVVTSSDRNIMQTVNGIPSLRLYQQYLDIREDKHFYELAVVFPFRFTTNGVPALRVVTGYTEDGALVMGADIPEGSKGNLTFGDPSFILDSVEQCADELQKFSPDIIRLFSCTSRHFFWGTDVDRETLPFENVAPTSGFYTAGEFHRKGRTITQHNVTIVTLAIREFDPDLTRTFSAVNVHRDNLDRQILINHCLTSFINVASQELIEANQQLEQMAITDGLTGLYNRAETERRIVSALESYSAGTLTLPPVLIMIDLDHFKTVNDNYGHQEGDILLRNVSGVFRSVCKKYQAEAVIGRWGGEEFMLLLTNYSFETAAELANDIRRTFSSKVSRVSGRHTLCAGVAEAIPDDTMDSFVKRADRGLYQAKAQGRNQIVQIK
ncbi:MAG: diguanylate cyclase, partial [Clostridia bacterium]|nr:diguanylate cyclase [Clostridia bacterium]